MGVAIFKAEFANRILGLAIAALRQAPGDV